MKPLIRINDPSIIDVEFISHEISASKRVIIQFSHKSYNSKTLAQLNKLCGEYSEDLQVRFYGHYQTVFDFKTLLKINNVKALYVDCLRKAENVSVIERLGNLQLLSLGIDELKETEILSYHNLKNISELTIGRTHTKVLNLAYLKDYDRLRALGVVGHTKNIENIGEASLLENLSLNCVKQVPVGFVNKLKELKNLKFILGSRENIDEIEGGKIEDLEFFQVQGLMTVDGACSFKNLKKFRIENQLQLSGIDFNEIMPALSELKIINCKRLKYLTGLDNIKELQHLRIYKTAIDFNDFINQKLPQALKTLAFYTSKQKVDEGIKAVLKSRGYYEYQEK